MGSFANPFDAAMNATCTIYEKGQSGANAYNQPSQQLVSIVVNWPCRCTILRDGNKYMKGKEYAHRMYLLFMRPITQDKNGQPFTLNEHYWAIVNTPGDGPELKLNIENVLDPSGLGHHLEVRAEMVIP